MAEAMSMLGEAAASRRYTADIWIMLDMQIT